MATVTLKVQGSDGTTKDVLLDTITGQTYALPLYKLGLGAVGADDGPVSSSNPMPTDDQSVVSLLKTQITLLGKIELQLSLITETKINDKLNILE